MVITLFSYYLFIVFNSLRTTGWTENMKGNRKASREESRYVDNLPRPIHYIMFWQASFSPLCKKRQPHQFLFSFFVFNWVFIRFCVFVCTNTSFFYNLIVLFAIAFRRKWKKWQGTLHVIYWHLGILTLNVIKTEICKETKRK